MSWSLNSTILIYRKNFESQKNLEKKQIINRIKSDKKQKIKDNLLDTSKSPSKIYCRSQVPKFVERCQGNYGSKQIPFETEDYLLRKCNRTSTFTVNGKGKKVQALNIATLATSGWKNTQTRSRNLDYNYFSLSLISIDEKKH